MKEEQTILSIENLSKTFRDFWLRPTVKAVDGISLKINRGDVFGLLGPNGSGKSTTIKMILGLLQPTAGKIRMFGHSPDSIYARKRLGYLPELSHLHPFLTARETLKYYAGLCDLPRKEARGRIAELLEMTGLESAADRAVGEYSKGMARRIALSCALIGKPELLILDEPTSGLDPVSTNEVKTLIKELSRSGMTILTTSHLLGDTEDMCNRVAILDYGKIAAEGKIGEIGESLEAFFLSKVGEGRNFKVAPFLTK